MKQSFRASGKRPSAQRAGGARQKLPPAPEVSIREREEAELKEDDLFQGLVGSDDEDGDGDEDDASEDDEYFEDDDEEDQEEDDSEDEEDSEEDDDDEADPATTTTPTAPTLTQGQIKSAEYDDEFHSSDEDFEMNTTGDVPTEWYAKTFDHIGYSRDGKQLMAKNQLDVIQRTLLYRGNSQESKDFRRSIYDEKNDTVTVLTDRELHLVQRILQSSFPHPEFNAEPELIPYYSGEAMKMSLSNGPEPKSRFLPSKWERMKVEKICQGLRDGTIRSAKQREEEAKPKPLYLLWGEDGSVIHDESTTSKRRHPSQPAPKMVLPGHAESYNAPQEYLPDGAPSQPGKMRRIPHYSKFVQDRFERCLDLYLCARQTKRKLTIDPESLVPRLPLPRELRPFPTTLALSFIGHVGKVNSIAVKGEVVASGGADGVVKLWDVATGRCLRTHVFPGELDVAKLAWNPKLPSVLACAVGGSVHLLHFDGGNGVGGEFPAPPPPSSASVSLDEDAAEGGEPKARCQWIEPSTLSGAMEIVVGETVVDLVWHAKGDFFCSVSLVPGKSRVLVHCLSKRKTQQAFRKLKGDPQRVVFHPTKPVLCCATKTHVVIYHLTKQETIKKLQAGVKWISSIAIHPSGDHIVVGSYDCRVAWFDLDLGNRPFKVMKYHTRAVRSVCFHPRYPLLASVSDDGMVNVFHCTVYTDDLSRNPLIVPVKKITAHDVVGGRGVLDGQFHPTQPWIATSGADGLCALFSNIP